MRKWISMILVLLVALTGCSKEAEPVQVEIEKPQNLDQMKVTARAYAEDLVQGNYQEAYEDYVHSEKMIEAVDADMYEEIMEGVYQMTGQPVAILDTADWISQGYQIVQVAVAFENMNYGINVVFTEDGEIGGLNFSDVAKVEEEESVSELSVVTETIAVGPFELEGELMFPADMEVRSAPVPAVILVHGSGASDKDETIGPNKPFLDIAEGLADAGVATLRYDKRAFAHAESFAEAYDFTVWEETIEDALAAVEVAKADPRIDNDRIYVLGHSLGGYLIPKMMKHTNEVSGWIFMAASNQPMTDMIIDQYTYLVELDGEVTEAEQEILDQTKSLVDQLEKPEELDAETPIMGAYPAYWIDLDAYRPLEEIMFYTSPKLFLQGERDYQVPPAQFELWKETLGEDYAEFRLFEGLNHLMMPGEGDPNPGEYQLPNHVDQEVVDAIAEFVNRAE
jgi:hypothetical protein